MAQRFYFEKDFSFIGRNKRGVMIWVRAYKAGTMVLVPNHQIEAVEKSGAARRIDAGQSASGSASKSHPL
jgi:hypothetical protein